MADDSSVLVVCLTLLTQCWRFPSIVELEGTLSIALVTRQCIRKCQHWTAHANEERTKRKKLRTTKGKEKRETKLNASLGHEGGGDRKAANWNQNSTCMVFRHSHQLVQMILLHFGEGLI